MPDVVDNVKVGEFIKDLLTKHQMTQNDLALKLNISRSAVSQNLNGRSTFDLQNLMKIAEIFSISLDQLLQMKSKRAEDAVSEYQRLLQKGLDELKNIPRNKINIAEPDIYGKTFVEYVIESNQKDIFLYLVQEKYQLYLHNHTSAAEVLEQIIVYAAKIQANDMFHYIDEFVLLFGSLHFSNEEIEKEFYTSLEKWTEEKIKKRMLEETITIEKPFLKIFKIKQKRPILSTIDWAKYIGKYHLDSFLEKYVHTHSLVDFYDRIIDLFVQYGYISGCDIIIDLFPKHELSSLRKKNQISQNTILLISRIDRIDILEKYLKKGIVSDYTELAIQTSKENQLDMTKHILEHYKQYMDFKKLGDSLLLSSNEYMLKEIINDFEQDDLDYLLGKIAPSELSIVAFLIESGATFQVKYFNRETAKKMNRLIQHYEGRVEE